MKISPKAQTALDQVIARFQSGDLSPVVAVAHFPIPQDWPASRWSFRNQVIAFAQTGTLHCRGFRQWQEIGRQVQKGNTASYIWGPKTKSEPADADSDETITRLIGFITIPVFPEQATAGEPLPAYDFTPKELPPLADVAARLGIDVVYQPTSPDRRGDYRPGRDLINLGTHHPRTFWHELGHAIHYRIEPDAARQDAERKEIVAEFCACALAALYGHDISGNSWAYISRYHSDPLAAILAALDTVQKILIYLNV